MIKVFVSIWFLSFINFTSGAFENCVVQINLTASNDQTINSPYYPNYRYPSGSSCRYDIIAPVGFYITATCLMNIDKPSSSCTTELFYIQNEGLQNLALSEYFCGFGSVTRSSLFNRMTLAYTSSSTNNAGYFSCKIQTTLQPCDCGWSITTKIVGGLVTTSNEFPSMVGIVDRTKDSIICGGTIISNRQILTAAHCIEKIYDPSTILALVGDQDYTISDDTPYSMLYNIESLKIHENYNTNTKSNDIAILRTLGEITWYRGIGPACLPYYQQNTDLTGNKVDVAGWGSKFFGGPKSTTLLKTRLDVISNSNCAQQNQGIDNTKICTYTVGRDTCQYDSGGPIYLRNNRMFLVGIVSYGYACSTSRPSVNTRVSSYLNWIQSNTPGVNYCVK